MQQACMTDEKHPVKTSVVHGTGLNSALQSSKSILNFSIISSEIKFHSSI